MLGDMSDRWSVLQHKHKNKLALCSTPSFPEGNVMHGQKHLNRLQALGFTAAGIASNASDASSQAGNPRLDSTPGFSGIRG